MCAGWFCSAGRSVECLPGHHISCLSSIGQIDVKIFVVQDDVLNLQTNIVKFYLFINAHVFISTISKTKSSLYGHYAKDINTYVYI